MEGLHNQTLSGSINRLVEEGLEGKGSTDTRVVGERELVEAVLTYHPPTHRVYLHQS